MILDHAQEQESLFPATRVLQLKPPRGPIMRRKSSAGADIPRLRKEGKLDTVRPHLTASKPKDLHDFYSPGTSSRC
jgi:hypothetical protein